MSINKFLMEHGHSHSFTHCPKLFLCHHSRAELSWDAQSTEPGICTLQPFTEQFANFWCILNWSARMALLKLKSDQVIPLLSPKKMHPLKYNSISGIAYLFGNYLLYNKIMVCVRNYIDGLIYIFLIDMRKVSRTHPLLCNKFIYWGINLTVRMLL